MLPNKQRGVRRVNDRRVLNGIFWVLRSGAPWRDLPETYGPRTTCYNRFVRWRRAGVWDQIMEALAAGHDAVVDTNGLPVHLALTPGEAHDNRLCSVLLSALLPQTMLLAYRGYDADWIRELARQQGAWANIPPKRNRKAPICFSPYLYRPRNLIERFFNKIKQCRRVATRYDKLAANYLAFVKLASIRIWLRANESPNRIMIQGISAPCMPPGLVPVLARGIDDAAVGLEELVGNLEDREHQPALGTPRDVAAAWLAPDEFAGLGLDALCRAFLVDEVALQNVGLLDMDVLVVGQHRARLKPHQRGHQAGRAVEQQRLGLAAGEAGLLPLHAVGANQVGMAIGGLRALRRHSVHGDAPFH